MMRKKPKQLRPSLPPVGCVLDLLSILKNERIRKCVLGNILLIVDGNIFLRRQRCSAQQKEETEKINTGHFPT
jgi:hypothetical protein